MKHYPKTALAEFEAASEKLRKKSQCLWCGVPLPKKKGTQFCSRPQCERAWLNQRENLSRHSA